MELDIKTDVLKLSASDNIGVALKAYSSSNISIGDKIALKKIQSGDKVLKYGFTIGLSTEKFEVGDRIASEAIDLPNLDESEIFQQQSNLDWAKKMPTTFYGFKRSNGTVGVRNYIVVCSTVNCSSNVSQRVADHFKDQDFGIIDGVVPIKHQSGCAQIVGGRSFELLGQTLAGHIAHPNVVGAVIIGLGCEQLTFKTLLGPRFENLDFPLEFVSIQNVGGTTKAVESGVKKVEELIRQLKIPKREEVSLANLKIAVQCGGSDSFSAITANPALGLVSDYLVSLGGGVVLSELPELYGLENTLFSRCENDEVKTKLRSFFEWWNKHLSYYGGHQNNNLSSGNMAGGLANILEKSLGAMMKGGSSSVTTALDFAEAFNGKGLAIMNGPGFDPVSVTGQVATGCQLVVFTTGRGSTFGQVISPTLKVTTQDQLFQSMPDDMDINGGQALKESSPNGLAQSILKSIVETSSGKASKSEILKMGQEEFCPWNLGDVL